MSSSAEEPFEVLHGLATSVLARPSQSNFGDIQLLPATEVIQYTVAQLSVTRLSAQLL